VQQELDAQGPRAIDAMALFRPINDIGAAVAISQKSTADSNFFNLETRSQSQHSCQPSTMALHADVYEPETIRKILKNLEAPSQRGKFESTWKANVRHIILFAFTTI
jgi:hypothetical protein